MKITGIIRRLDRTGRFTIPKELRESMGIKENEDYIEIYVENDTIILRKTKKNNNT